MAILASIVVKLARSARRRRLVADDRGTTAIEFGILAVPFFALLAAILETAYVFLASQILDTAVQDSARLIRTGQVQGASFNLADFRSNVCDGLYQLFDCNKLLIRVQTVNDFTSAAAPAALPDDCVEANCDWETYNPGGGSAIVLVRVFYRWPTLVNLGGFNLQNTGTGHRLLGSVRVFRNEPF